MQIKSLLQNCRDILQNGVWDTDLNGPAPLGGRHSGPYSQEIRYRQPLRSLQGISHSHHPPHFLENRCGRAAVDLAEKIQQHPRSEQPYLGFLGRREPAPSAKPTAISWGSSTTIPRGILDQVDRVLYDLKHNPASRRILTNIYNSSRSVMRWTCTPVPTP